MGVDRAPATQPAVATLMERGEKLVTVGEACKWLNDHGVRINVRSLYNWATRAPEGSIKLDYQFVGKTWYTSIEALERRLRADQAAHQRRVQARAMAKRGEVPVSAA